MLLGVGGGGPRSTFIGRTIGSTASGQTFSNVAIGNADANRLVAVVVWLYNTSGSPLPTSVTIGGATAALQTFYVDIGNGSRGAVGIAYLSVPTGTTTNIVVNFSGSVSNNVEIATYRIITTNPVAVDWDTLENSNGTKSLTLTGGGVGIWASAGWSAGWNYSSAVNAVKDSEMSTRFDRQMLCGTIIDPTQQFSIVMSGGSPVWELAGICWV